MLEAAHREGRCTYSADGLSSELIISEIYPDAVEAGCIVSVPNSELNPI